MAEEDKFYKYSTYILLASARSPKGIYPKEVEKIANRITLSNNENGVSEALNKYILNL